jgi:hypothetical protein
MLTEVRRVEDLEAMKGHCAVTGPWERQCRSDWVQKHLRRKDWRLLVEVCGEDESCIFDVVDGEPGPIDERLSRCALLKSGMSVHCARHALSAWWDQCPDAAEIHALARFDTVHPEEVGAYLGALVGCEGRGSCDGDFYVRRYCELQVEDLAAHPGKCANWARPACQGRRGTLRPRPVEPVHGPHIGP